MAAWLSRDGNHSRSFQVMMEGIERIFKEEEELNVDSKIQFIKLYNANNVSTICMFPMYGMNMKKIPSIRILSFLTVILENYFYKCNCFYFR